VSCVNVSGGDELLLLQVLCIDGSVVKAELRSASNSSGGVNRISAWPGDPHSIAVGISSNSFSFEVLRASIVMENRDGISDGDSLSGNAVCPILFHEGLEVIGSPTAFPEVCTHFTVIPDHGNNRDDLTDNEAADVSDADHLHQHQHRHHGDAVVVGLSSRNKFYCGEALLVSGVSSFVVNAPLQVLMYVTTGTRPQLHFSSFSSLRSVDPLRGEIWEDQLATATMPGAEPRPVERGAKLVGNLCLIMS
jgi:hypothetical protein